MLFRLTAAIRRMTVNNSNWAEPVGLTSSGAIVIMRQPERRGLREDGKLG